MTSNDGMMHESSIARQSPHGMVHNFLDMDDLFTQGGLSLDRLKTFCLIAEAGGFTKAARGDVTKQPLFSRQLKELEAFFGVELVRRSGKNMALTDKGKRLYRLARDYFGALSDFKKVCASQPVKLQIGAGDSVIQWLILPKLAAARKALPQANLRLLNLPTKEIVEKVESGELDLGVVRQSGTTERVKTVALGKLEFALFVPKKTMPKGAEDDWRAVLRTCPLAMLEGAGEFRQGLQKAAAKEGFEPRIEIECSSFPAVAKAMNCAYLSGLLPVAAAQDLAKGEFVQMSAPWINRLARAMVLIWNPRTAEIRHHVEDAVDCLVEAWAG